MKALEALEKLTNYKCSCMSEKIECKNIIEKELKALEILKEKEVDIYFLKRIKNLEEYNFYAIHDDNQILTQEEYDLLKEVL